MDITPTAPSAAAEKSSTKTAASTDKKAKKGAY
jgi:hypothetical protein